MAKRNRQPVVEDARMKAIATNYKGVEFRSRLEANVAQLFDKLGWEWEYEAVSFLLPSGVHYRPDFVVDEIGAYVECRGYVSQKGEKQLAEFSRWLSSDPKGVDYRNFLVFHTAHSYACILGSGNRRKRRSSWFPPDRNCDQSILRQCPTCLRFDVEEQGYLSLYCPACDEFANSMLFSAFECQDGGIRIGGVPIPEWDPIRGGYQTPSKSSEMGQH